MTPLIGVGDVKNSSLSVVVINFSPLIMKVESFLGEENYIDPSKNKIGVYYFCFVLL